MKRTIAICLAIVMCFSLAACSNTDAKKNTTVNFESKHLVFTYDSSIFDISQSDDEEEFVVSLYPMGADSFSVPRIDMIKVDVSSITTDMINQDNSEIIKFYESFIYGHMTSYYGLEEDEDGNIVGDPLTITFQDTSAEADEGGGKHLFTKGTIAEYDNVPEMFFEAEVIGVTNGVLIISFYQSTLNEESLAIINNVISSIRYNQ